MKMTKYTGKPKSIECWMLLPSGPGAVRRGHLLYATLRLCDPARITRRSQNVTVSQSD